LRRGDKSMIDQYDPKKCIEDVIVSALKKNKIFSTLAEEELIKISPLFVKLDFKNGEYICMEGDRSEWIYSVMQGRVKTIKHTLSGRDIILGIYLAGDMFCCDTIFNNKPYSESVQVKGDVEVIRVSHKNFLKIMNEYPLLRIVVANYINDKLSDAYDKIKDISTELVEKRIISILLKYSERAGIESSGYRKIDFRLTRQEIAEMVFTTVETCIRMMSKFQKRGIVKYSGNRIYVKRKPLEKCLLMY
jgi:CRP/FNR family transcriptional regulator